MIYAMLFITGAIIFVTALCPLMTWLVSISPLDKILHWSRTVDDYADMMAYGLGAWAVIAFIVGWIIAIIKIVC